MTHFNVELWNIHQLCILQVLNVEEANQTRKVEKLVKAKMSRHNFRGTNIYDVETKMKLNSS